ncbi:AGAP010623-PA-like protein [Anopheles sinensis]|uniref:X-box-binding protein 1 n=1 Tax=Anopheles sinensis TaxID=74873 RepID=A0A084WLQ9_ANOSI|nr:AGAP010623-PA-like protein [Anopheles sinensis]
MDTPIYITLPAEYFSVVGQPAIIGLKQEQEPEVGKAKSVVSSKKVAILPEKKRIVAASMEKRPVPLSENKPLAPAEPHSEDDDCSSMDELVSRGKKRRLDHLTWEEKLQRKKLKNRVAAQTSRDRKKAKMEEMEKTIQEQADQITVLQGRCSALDKEKGDIYGKYLDLERRFEELQRRLEATEERARKAGESAHGAADDGGRTEQGRSGGSANDTPPVVNGRRAADGPLEDHCHLPTLQDMLEDFDVSKLEELAESLLAGVGADLEGIDRPGSPADAEGGRTGERLPGSVVGPAAAVVEPGRPAPPALQPADSGSRLILTTHNYSKSPFYELSDEKQEEEVEEKLKAQLALVPEDESKAVLESNSSDTLYGTYDNETNCITIVLANEDVEVQDAEQIKAEPVSPELKEEEISIEVEMEEEAMGSETASEAPLSPLEPLFIRPPSPLQDLLSPIAPAHHHSPLKSPGGFSSVSSDCGYESLASPVSSTFGSASMFAPALDGSKAPSTTTTTTTTECPADGDVVDFSDSTAMSLDYALNDFDEFWNLDLFPILE